MALDWLSEQIALFCGHGRTVAEKIRDRATNCQPGLLAQCKIDNSNPAAKIKWMRILTARFSRAELSCNTAICTVRTYVHICELSSQPTTTTV
jgi:hypothetical protein